MSTRSNSARSNRMSVMLAAAERYIAFDKSDPFTRDRVHSHILNGIATPMRASRAAPEKYNYDDYGRAVQMGEGQLDAFYDCDQRVEHREYTDAGGVVEKYAVPTYTNIVRP